MTTPAIPRTWKAWITVGRHIDGDTLVAEVLSLGWGIHLRPLSPTKPGPCAIRVLHPSAEPYDAPERGTTAGRAALAYVRTLLPVGNTVAIESYGFDDFGRTLASITLPDGRDLAHAMTAAGHTKPEVP